MKRRKDYLCTPVAEGILTFLVIPAKNEILTENTENGDVLIWKWRHPPPQHPAMSSISKKLKDREENYSFGTWTQGKILQDIF